jgi:hypothetical protein
MVWVWDKLNSPPDKTFPKSQNPREIAIINDHNENHLYPITKSKLWQCSF